MVLRSLCDKRQFQLTIFWCYKYIIHHYEYFVASFKTVYYTPKVDTCSLSYDPQKIHDTFYMVVTHTMNMSTCNFMWMLVAHELPYRTKSRFCFTSNLYYFQWFSWTPQLKLSTLRYHIVLWWKIITFTTSILNLNLKLNTLKVYIV